MDIISLHRLIPDWLPNASLTASAILPLSGEVSITYRQNSNIQFIILTYMLACFSINLFII